MIQKSFCFRVQTLRTLSIETIEIDSNSRIMDTKALVTTVNRLEHQGIGRDSIKSLFTISEDHDGIMVGPIVGRVHTSRQGGSVTFVELYDSSTIKPIQCVVKGKEIFHQGSVISISGRVIRTPDAKQPVEIKVSDFQVIGSVVDLSSYPLAGKSAVSREVMRTFPHLRIRSRLFGALGLIKQTVYRALHESFTAQGIGEIQPVTITGNECEEGSHPFQVTTVPLVGTADMDMEDVRMESDFFKKWVYLTVSGQLHLEAVVLGLLTDGYCMTTAFRAEPSKTQLHAAEFPMPEWELMSGLLSTNIQVASTLVKDIIAEVLRQHRYELEYLEDYIRREIPDSDIGALIERLERYRDTEFVVTTHHQCVKRMLQDVKDGKMEFTELPAYTDDFTKEHEYYICQMYGDIPVFVRYYPKAIKAFYMPVIDLEEDEVPRVDCFDMLFPHIGEVVGGSTRIHKEDELVERMTELDMDLEPLDWYIKLRRYGTHPHGGAGLGLSRLLMVITGIKNIRDMMDFPRTYRSACYA
jgi:asparaginyl-tRNA synthetase